MDERRAIERLKRGEASGLETLVEGYQAQAVRTAYLILHDRSLAEDVAQGAFILVYRRIETFDPDRPFGPWFMKIVVNEALKTASRSGRESRFVGDDASAAQVVDDTPGPHELAEEAEARHRVWEALKELPPAQRAAVVQRYYLGMSEAEMAETVDSAPGTIKWRLYAARKKLTEVLGYETEGMDG